MNEEMNNLKACIYNTNSVRILEILELINFTGKCRIKTDDLTIILAEKEGVCQSAWTESEGDEIQPCFYGLKDSSLLRRINEINPLGREICLYVRNNSEDEILDDFKGAKGTITEDEGVAPGKTDNSAEHSAGIIEDNPDLLFEEELSKLDSASIIKMKEKFKREMEYLAGEILNEKNE